LFLADRETLLNGTIVRLYLYYRKTPIAVSIKGKALAVGTSSDSDVIYDAMKYDVTSDINNSISNRVLFIAADVNH